MFKIDIIFEDKNNVCTFIDALKNGGLSAACGHGMYGMSQFFGRTVQQAYKTYSGHEWHPMTKAVYAIGKRPGKSPAKQPWPGARPMNRSGALSKSISIYQDGSDPGARYSYIVGIKPEDTYGSIGMGEPNDTAKGLATIAHQLEFPRPFTVRVTKEMLAYVNVLWNHMAGGTSRDRGASNRGFAKVFTVGATILIHPKPRPVWTRTVIALKTQGPQVFLEYFIPRLAAIAKNPAQRLPPPPRQSAIL